jgi:hypothetical protein
MNLKPFGIVLAGLSLVASRAGAQRRIDGNTLVSDTLPAIELTLDSSFAYLGTQRFILYDVATAEQFFFAETDGKRIKRYLWVQFEGYLPGNNHTYDYSADATTTMWGRSIHRTSELRQIPLTEQRPASDGARARQFLRDRGLTLGPRVLYHRLVWLLDTPARHELMLIYMEDLGDHYQGTARPDEAQLQSLLAASLARAEKSIRLRSR